MNKFALAPNPPSEAALQQYEMLRHHLANGSWQAACAQAGPTPDHVPLLSAMWVIGYSNQGKLYNLHHNGHRLAWRYTAERGMRVEVDDFPTSFTPDNLRVMLT